MGNMNEPVLTAEDVQSRSILDALKKLPQAGHFKPAHITRFLDTYRNNPRALWHVNRLSGIGGSEIGIMVAALRGEQDAFGDVPPDVIREKLLSIPPKKTALAMRKGIVAETCIRQFFLEDYKATRDLKSLELLESGNFKRPREWMRYSPDDIVFIGDRRYLVDYKYPAEATLHDNVWLRYISQLHMGNMVLEYNNIHIDGMLLVQYPEKGDDLVVSEIERDDQIDADILRGGQMAWDEIVAGRVPPFDFADDLPRQLSSGDIERLGELSESFTKNKAMADALYAELSEIKESIAQTIIPRGLESGSKLKLNGVNVSVSEKFSPETAAVAIGDDAQAAKVPLFSNEKMSAYLRASGVDMEQFETGEFVFDEGKLREMMADRALSAKQFMAQNLRMTLSCTNNYKEAAKIAAFGARDNFQVAVESKSPARPLKSKL